MRVSPTQAGNSCRRCIGCGTRPPVFAGAHSFCFVGPNSNGGNPVAVRYEANPADSIRCSTWSRV